MIFSDVFHDISVPSHLVTREYHREVRARLAPGGVYAVNVIEGGTSPRFLYSLVRTLAEDFAAVEVWTDVADTGTTRRITHVVIASDRPSPDGSVTAGFGSNRQWRRGAPDRLASAIADSGVPILTDDYAPVDRLLSHVLLDRELSER